MVNASRCDVWVGCACLPVCIVACFVGFWGCVFCIYRNLQEYTKLRQVEWDLKVFTDASTPGRLTKRGRLCVFLMYSLSCKLLGNNGIFILP